MEEADDGAPLVLGGFGAQPPPHAGSAEVVDDLLVLVQTDKRVVLAVVAELGLELACMIQALTSQVGGDGVEKFVPTEPLFTVLGDGDLLIGVEVGHHHGNQATDDVPSLIMDVPRHPRPKQAEACHGRPEPYPLLHR